jgi:MerR family transcriptional regulator, light-induced transcriptional regulator
MRQKETADFRETQPKKLGARLPENRSRKRLIKTGEDLPVGNARQFVEVLSRIVECESFKDEARFDSGNQSRFSSKKTGKKLESGSREVILARTIEAEIIPRLMLSHRLGPNHTSVTHRKAKIIEKADVEEFTRLVVLHDVTVAEAYVRVFRDQGVSMEDIFMQVLAPSAKRLGELWLTDHCSFTDVTVGLSRIYQLVHRLGPQFESETGRAACGRTAFLAPVPGEQHGLGLLLVEEFFRREGWDVWSPSSITSNEIIQTVGREHYDMIGISVTCGALIDDLASVIQAARRESRNKNVIVMVGGRFFNQNPELVERVGADATDTDGSQAINRLDACATRLRNG